MMDLCPECGSELPSSAAACPSCGYEPESLEAPLAVAEAEDSAGGLAPAADVEAEGAAPTEEKPVSAALCTACGAGLPDDARFCPRCGEALVVAEAAQVQQAAVKRSSRKAGVTAGPAAAEQDREATDLSEAAEREEEDDLTPGTWIQATEELFPIAWLTMLIAVAYIGIYFAVDRLAGQNLLPGPGWF